MSGTSEKIKVKLTAQTFSASVADSLGFLDYDLKDPEFKGCSFTIEFIRNIDRLFDLLNSRHAFEKGFKAVISNFNLSMQKKCY